MAMRHLTEAEVNTLLVKLTLAGYIPGRDFKVDENGRIWTKKETFAFLKRTPALPEADDDFCNERQRSLTPAS